MQSVTCACGRTLSEDNNTCPRCGRPLRPALNADAIERARLVEMAMQLSPTELADLRSGKLSLEANARRMLATIATLEHQRDEARAQSNELREAGRAMVEAAADMAPHCPRCHARVAVTKRCPGPRGGAWFSCDEHATADATDLNHAPALRRLRELTEKGQG